MHKLKYNEEFKCEVPEGITPAVANLWCFKHRVGLGRLEHFKRLVSILYPKRVWHDWTERRVRALCEHNFISWAGCGSSGKTDDSALWAIIWWLADPLHSTVILTSTTKGMIKKRIWPVVQRLYYSYYNNSQFPGTLIDSETLLRAQFDDDRKDAKSAIFAKAVKDGNTSKAAADIQGMHNDRVLIVIDEFTDTPPAIVEVLPNLMLGCKEFQVLGIGNPSSRLDQHGLFSEPLDGWNSIDESDDEWETVVQLDGKPGLCQRFDGEKSPNVLNPDKRYSFLFSKENLESARIKLTDKSPQYWKYCRGLWSPEGLCNTVMSEPEVIRCGGFDKVVFLGRSETYAGLDPAFGGDRCILKFADVGDMKEGGMCVLCTETVEIKIDASSSIPRDYQIAEQTIRECKARGVSPWNFGSDATGTGKGVFAIIHEEWSRMIHRCEFGGAPSDMRVGPDDSRTGKEVYYSRVAELWFTCRVLLRAGMLKGLDTDTVRDFVTREYSERRMVYRLQTKEEMKERYGKSPDNADALAVLVDVARKNGLFQGMIGKAAVEADNEWDRAVRECDEVYATADYSEE